MITKLICLIMIVLYFAIMSTLMFMMYWPVGLITSIILGISFIALLKGLYK